MFGLMKPVRSCGCNTQTPDYKQHRMHYCGTCKTIGSEYGHKARMVLNFDAVFLAELLSALSNEDTTQWQSGFQAINQCFTMPNAQEHFPLSMRYAGAANVLLAELKLDDNIRDKAKKRYKFARWFLSKSFKKATAQLQSWNVPTDNYWTWIQEQDAREKSQHIDFENLTDTLDYYAMPTAAMTAQLFEQGSIVVGQPEQAATMRDLGWQFGRLMYVLDAFEDVERDIFYREFNPLALYFNAQTTLSEVQFEQTRSLLQQIETELHSLFKQLHVAPEVAEKFNARLSSNLAVRLYVEREIPSTLAQRLQQRWQKAKKIADDLVCTPQSMAQKLKYYMVSLAVFITPHASEHIAPQEKGQVIGWLAVFTTLLATIGLGRLFLKKSKLAPPIQKKKKSLWQRFKDLFKRKNKANRADCWTVCCTDCCECCCSSCCNSSSSCNGCSTCCNSCCDDDGCCNCANWGKDGWRTFLWVMVSIIVVVAIIVVLVVFL